MVEVWGFAPEAREIFFTDEIHFYNNNMINHLLLIIKTISRTPSVCCKTFMPSKWQYAQALQLKG
jgi:hypothetical protein